ncbi:HAD family phosphatase [Tessaracoccus sp. OS52]|uniref:HAD family hydrolase n=1 Tax=Tessaracoccus sp. OS52 TaxID=2886691 RepID=UPI001D10E6A8|nr:HAD family phosphatase [Tessaracoccus sp. OS52]MCC2593225.1 HAD family phosphatase [Tessaracoccus sp. OS52]
MQPEAIIFDLDGTLIDTEALWDEVRRGLAAEAGLPWPEGTTQAMMGMSTSEWARHLVEVVGLPMSPEEAARVTIEAMAKRHGEGIEVLPGAVEAVRAMAEHYPLAVASSSPRLLIETAVHALGLEDVFHVRVSTEEVAAGKPAPDGFLRAAELLGVDPSGCVAVEDSTNGIRSALNAGMKVIAVPPHFHPPAADLLAQTRVLDSLEELTLEVIESL